METAVMRPSHLHNDPSYTGQAPNMYLTSFEGQRQTPPQALQFHSHAQQGQSGQGGQGMMSSHSTTFSPNSVTSQELAGVSWEDFAASSWEAHAHMLEQQQQLTQRAPQPPHIQMPHDYQFGQGSHEHQQQHSDLGMQQTLGGLSATSPMEYSHSASASPVPEMSTQGAFASPLTPSSFDPDPQHQLQMRPPHIQGHHRHIRSSPSPSRTPPSPELLRRKSAPSGVKSVGASMSKISKSPKPAPPTAPANSRSAHSAIERKYRENINNKILELHKVLCTASPPLFAEQDQESSGGYPYSRLTKSGEEDCEPSTDLGGSCTQTALPAKKADVLAGAIAYVKRSERERKALMERLKELSMTLQTYQHMNPTGMGHVGHQ